MNLPNRRDRGRRNWFRFSAYNVISFSFLAGNIITLYARRLGAGPAVIGAIAAGYQLTFIFTLIGRSVIGRVGVVRLFGWSWALRYAAMVPAILAGLIWGVSRPDAAVGVLAVATFLFNLFKGIGMTGARPVLTSLTTDRDRGSFMATQSIIHNVGMIVAGVSIALLLGAQAPLGRYLALLTLGVAAGIGAAWHLLQLPEPDDGVPEGGVGVGGAFRELFDGGPFTHLNLLNALGTAVSAMVAAFLVVYFGDRYGFPDREIVFFVVAGSIGATAMSVFLRLVADRVGGKPLVVLTTVMMALALLPVLASPELPGAARWIVPAVVFALFTASQTGFIATIDIYFFAATDSDERLDRGVIFGIAGGVAGSLGSLGGGLLIGSLRRLGWPPSLVWSAFFAIAMIIAVAVIVLAARLARVGAMPLRDAFAVFVSPRDLRALRLVNRLRRSRTEESERAAIERISTSRSTVVLDELLERMRSPRVAIRQEAVASLRDTPLTATAVDALIAEVKAHPYTTAPVAAEILGGAGARAAIPALRSALDSPDYLLVARAARAIAQLDDRPSIPRIRRLLEESDNPRVVIYAAQALERFGDGASLPAILRRVTPDAQESVRDELILSAAGLMGIQERFYPLYSLFLVDRAEGVRALAEDVAPGDLRTAIEALVTDPAASVATLRDALGSGRRDAPGPQEGALCSALDAPAAATLPRLALLAAAWLTFGAGPTPPTIGGPDRRDSGAPVLPGGGTRS